MQNYKYDDSNPTYRVIKRTMVLAIGTITGAILLQDKATEIPYSNTFITKDIEVKCVMYSHIRLQGILRPIDKRVYLN